MDQHPIPRQITTFEFKLIGFMTLRQFLYLVIFFPLGFIVYKLFPIPFLNILTGAIVAGVGLALAFIPINDRPMEVWIRNFIKRLNSPTQYFFLKNNPPINIFGNLFFVADPHRVMTHIESQQKLNAYLSQTKKVGADNRQRRVLQGIIPLPPAVAAAPQAVVSGATPITNPSVSSLPVVDQPRQPFFTGVVKNNKKIPLPGIMIYVKDGTDKAVRLLKTNPHGVFATYNPLPAAEYLFEVKDPKGTYFFDTIKLKVETVNSAPFEFQSKELL